MMDTTWFAPFAGVLAIFHVTMGQVVSGALQVIGAVNTIKALAPNLIDTKRYPLIALIISFLVAFGNLWPNWAGAIVCGVLLWLIQWLTWVGAKKAAVAAKLRE